MYYENYFILFENAHKKIKLISLDKPKDAIITKKKTNMSENAQKAKETRILKTILIFEKLSSKSFSEEFNVSFF